MKNVQFFATLLTAFNPPNGVFNIADPCPNATSIVCYSSSNTSKHIHAFSIPISLPGGLYQLRSISMTPTSDSEHAPLQALSPIAIANAQLMLPRKPSSSSLSDTEPSLVSRNPKADDAQNSNSALHLPHTLPTPPTKHNSSHTLASRIYERSPSVGASVRSSPSIPWKEQEQEPRQIIWSSFAPRVAVYTSADTEDFIRLKGFHEGLRGLLRPFGERIQGKVVIRDSIGASKGWEDFGIRFTDPTTLQFIETRDDSKGANGLQQSHNMRKASYDFDPAAAIDKVIGHHLGSEGELLEGITNSINPDHKSPNMSLTKHTMYTFYLRKLLSSTPILPYETFAHPVACIIAISSRNPAPIDTLRQLYASTGHSSNGIPAWISTEYLRYYVLMHDEENDDITKSTALFDLMKRHFGLHCHLLSLRSSQCVPTDDDSILVPSCEWLSADEELAQIRRKGKFPRCLNSLFTSLSSKITLMTLRTMKYIYTNLMLLQSRAFFGRW